MAARLLTDDEAGADAIVAEINVTPLTDIFLVLLIIFMVTSSALMQQGSKVSLPQTATGNPPETAGLTITATADHTLELNGVKLQRDQLRDALGKALADRPDKGVVLRGDRTIILEDAVQIMTIAREAGADKLAIATTPTSAAH
jgi:biopolymer transport protein ExbD